MVDESPAEDLKAKVESLRFQIEQQRIELLKAKDRNLDLAKRYDALVLAHDSLERELRERTESRRRSGLLHRLRRAITSRGKS